MTRRWALLAGVLILAGSQPDGHRRPWRSARDSAAEQQVGSGPIVSSAARTAATEYGTFPLAFEPNLGQSERPVEFLARGPGYGVFLTGGHAVIGCRARLPPVATRSPCASWERIRRPSRQVRTQQPAWPTTSSAMTRRVGLRTSRRIGGFATPTSTPGIDLVYHGRQRSLEYDFVLAPGADPSAISFRYNGAEAPRVDSHGDLVLQAGSSRLTQHRPVAYQRTETGSTGPITVGLRRRPLMPTSRRGNKSTASARGRVRAGRCPSRPHASMR